MSFFSLPVAGLNILWTALARFGDRCLIAFQMTLILLRRQSVTHRANPLRTAVANGPVWPGPQKDC
ncbi:hypothetical protein [Streptomyces qinzhouensis]|uniref:Uncharacterized protein n=1 Tax=Streptomyces qinzhouensis TaxID=2599401 RepID=A0A5B8IH39_9ACTN|nr:hypothetical protein [Streptomyces qinzhouensis]QDY77552.1 hypothetical protein FQU76_14615 [Streptomyces qinzhouensis]